MDLHTFCRINATDAGTHRIASIKIAPSRSGAQALRRMMCSCRNQKWAFFCVTAAWVRFEIQLEQEVKDMYCSSQFCHHTKDILKSKQHWTPFMFIIIDNFWVNYQNRGQRLSLKDRERNILDIRIEDNPLFIQNVFHANSFIFSHISAPRTVPQQGRFRTKIA